MLYAYCWPNIIFQGVKFYFPLLMFLSTLLTSLSSKSCWILDIKIEKTLQQHLDAEENCRPWISWNVTWAHDGPEIFWYSSISLILLFSFLLFFHFVFLYIRMYYSMCAWTDRGCVCAVCVTCQIQLWKFPYHVLQQYHRLIFSSSVLSKKEQISVHVLQQTFGI